MEDTRDLLVALNIHYSKLRNDTEYSNTMRKVAKQESDRLNNKNDPFTYNRVLSGLLCGVYTPGDFS